MMITTKLINNNLVTIITNWPVCMLVIAAKSSVCPCKIPSCYTWREFGVQFTILVSIKKKKQKLLALLNKLRHVLFNIYKINLKLCSVPLMVLGSDLNVLTFKIDKSLLRNTCTHIMYIYFNQIDNSSMKCIYQKKGIYKI